MLTTIPTFQDAYYVSFEVMPTSTHSEWRNIIHFTADKNNEKYGDRIPAVWFVGHTTRLHICSAVNDNKNYCINTKEGVPFHEYTKVEISQEQQSDGSFLYQIRVGGNQIHSIINKQPRYFPNVKVYRSNPWDNAADAEVRNIMHRNLKHGM